MRNGGAARKNESAASFRKNGQPLDRVFFILVPLENSVNSLTKGNGLWIMKEAECII